jgi:hypothetical protein
MAPATTGGRDTLHGTLIVSIGGGDSRTLCGAPGGMAAEGRTGLHS